MRNGKKISAQAILEYVVLFAVILVALISVKFIKHAKDSFQVHADKCINEIAVQNRS